MPTSRERAFIQTDLPSGFYFEVIFMFERTSMLIDETTLEKIKNTKILLIGVGGVGGFAFEALIRLGFQNITIIDNDKLEKSNLNRQIISNIKNIGNFKTEEAKIRALNINPEVEIKTISIFLNSENIDSIFKYRIYKFITR